MALYWIADAAGATCVIKVRAAGKTSVAGTVIHADGMGGKYGSSNAQVNLLGNLKYSRTSGPLHSRHE
ncbi:hypothetical protein HDE80_000906 [Rhodanobacter sp. A1T4]|nr:hypothetical protein [Rhodanobacter sp. A1T4]